MLNATLVIRRVSEGDPLEIHLLIDRKAAPTKT